VAQRPAQRRYATAAALYAAALAQQPSFAPEHRYNAACAAALAGCGQGKDAAALTAAERLRWRRQALTSLRADLAARGKQLKSGFPGQAARARRSLEHWRRDPDFAGVRDREALARLPAEEQAAWRKLWAEVDALLAANAAPK